MNYNKRTLHKTMLKFIYEQKSIDDIFHLSIWEKFQNHCPDLSDLSAVDLLMEFYNKILPNLQQYQFETDTEYYYFCYIFNPQMSTMLQENYEEHQRCHSKVNYKFSLRIPIHYFKLHSSPQI